MMSLPPILVINLERSTDRRQHMEKELGRFEVAYSFFPAVDGAKLPKEDMKRYSMRRNIALNGYAMAPDVVACSLSHARIYEKMVAEKIEELLILEDDCIFNDHFFELLKNRKQWLPLHWSIVNFSCACDSAFELEGAFTPMSKINMSDSWLELVQIHGFHRRTSCYLLSLHAARSLLKLVYPIRAHADDLLGNMASYGLDCYTLFPALVDARGIMPPDILSNHDDTRPNRTLNMRWQTLYYALRYKDARKAYVKFRLHVLQQWLRKIYARLLGL